MNKKTVWIDLLCFGSVMKLMGLSKQYGIKKVYYINSKGLTDSLLQNFVKNSLGAEVEQVIDIAEGDERIGDRTLYELIQQKPIDVLNQWVEQDIIKQRIYSFCQKRGFNPDKYREHLKEAAYQHIYRVGEISVLAEKFSDSAETIILLRKNRLSSLNFFIFKSQQIEYYNTFLSHKFGIQKRKSYLYDIYFNRRYYSDRIGDIGKMILIHVFALPNMILSKMLNKESKTEKNNQTNIGVELIQGRVRLDEINDVYWIKNTRIDPKSIWGIEFEDYDEESKAVLDSLEINRCKVLRSPKRWIGMMENNDGKTRFVTITFGDWLKASKAVFSSLFSIFVIGEESWLHYQECLYRSGVEFWSSIYRQLGMKILWTMHDTDPEFLIKGEAIEKLKGLSMASHWSNYPVKSMEAQKCCDVFFTWGEYFSKNIFDDFAYSGIFTVGYPSDHYFESRTDRARLLKQKFENKFVLCYQDNYVANDFKDTQRMQNDMHKMLMRLLDKYKDLVVLLKPKRSKLLDDVMRELPELESYIKNQRIQCFLGDTPRTKAVPAETAMASDLVIGLGISTAASESHFAGTTSFHADLTGFLDNKFGQKGLGKVVFRTIESLSEAIEKKIEKTDQTTYADYEKYYEMLDPFQDGKPYERTEFVIRELQDSLKMDVNRNDAVFQVQNKFNETFKTSNQRMVTA